MAWIDLPLFQFIIHDIIRYYLFLTSTDYDFNNLDSCPIVNSPRLYPATYFSLPFTIHFSQCVRSDTSRTTLEYFHIKNVKGYTKIGIILPKGSFHKQRRLLACPLFHLFIFHVHFIVSFFSYTTYNKLHKMLKISIWHYFI